MNFNEHSDLKGRHSFLSASKYHWINYDDAKFMKAFDNYQAALNGTLDHEFACLCIRRGQKLPKTKQTLNMYVNDAIGFRLKPEVVLRYSQDCFVTADAIDFKEKNNMLRIHDLKTGITPAHMEQLEVYAAYFCLEYGKDPYKIATELRIYQMNEIIVHEPEPEVIKDIMNKIVRFNKLIRERSPEVM